MAQAPLTTSKMFTAKWTERDEAVLVDLLKRKIHEIRWEIHESNSPYARAKLRKTRAEYKKLLEKVQRGDYDPNILAAEMKTHSEFNTIQRERREKALGKYVDAYSDVNFDFESYFSKTRYFGAACPLVTIILLAVLLTVLLCSLFLSSANINQINETLYDSTGVRMTVTSVAYIRLGPGELDFQVPNDGNWPAGTFINENEALEQGEKYEADDHTIPENVWLYEDLQMATLDITVIDVIKALFRTPMFSENRLDIIEDQDSMQGYSLYYIRFLRSRSEDIEITRDEAGNINWLNIVRHIATYGTIVFLVLTLILIVVELVFNIGRMFSYTTRRLHVLPILIMLCLILTAICPAFIELQALDSKSVNAAFTNYFSTDWEMFVTDSLYNADGTLNSSAALTCINMAFPILAVIPFVVALLPLLFRNRREQTVAYVPKGNKKHTYAGQRTPTAAGQPGDKNALKKTSGKVARAGSRSPTGSRYPRR